jgi:hypothetical protein
MTVLTLPGAGGADHPGAAVRVSRIRVRRAPRLEPLYDDERADAGTLAAIDPHAPELPIDWTPAIEQEARRTGTPARGGLMVPERPSGNAPSPLGSAERYVRLCLEVLNGFRPNAHLRTLAGPVEFAEVVAQLNRRRNGVGRNGAPVSTPGTNRVAGNVGGPRRGRAPHGADSSQSEADRWPAGQSAGAPGNRGKAFRANESSPTPTRNKISAVDPFRLLKLHVSEPRDGVAEVVAVLSHGGVSLAMAMRLERRSSQWLCALVQVV